MERRYKNNKIWNIEKLTLPFDNHRKPQYVMGPKFAICTITERYEAKLQDSGNLFTNNGSSTQSPFMLIQELIPNKMARTSIKTRRLFILTRISIFDVCDVYMCVFKVDIFFSNEIYKFETRKFDFQSVLRNVFKLFSSTIIFTTDQIDATPTKGKTSSFIFQITYKMTHHDWWWCEYMTWLLSVQYFNVINTQL